jgi:hypothetical protein
MPDQGENLIFVETSIVVVGEDCNPSILNPDFLRVQGIVPAEWGWALADAPLTTRNLSVVTYDCEVTIKVEPNRFQVTDASGSAPDAHARLLKIARRYVEVLPHVRYTAVGNNFQRFLAVDAPLDMLQQHFIKQGPWLDKNSLDVGVSFAYDHDGGRLTLAFENKLLIAPQNDEFHQVEGVGIKANFHRECTGYPTHEQVFAHIEKLPADSDLLANRIAAFLST